MAVDTDPETEIHWKLAISYSMNSVRLGMEAVWPSEVPGVIWGLEIYFHLLPFSLIIGVQKAEV